jgi:hypothetical protein
MISTHPRHEGFLRQYADEDLEGCGQARQGPEEDEPGQKRAHGDLPVFKGEIVMI